MSVIGRLLHRKCKEKSVFCYTIRMATGGNFTSRCVGFTDDDQENQQNASAEAVDSVSIKYPCNPCTSTEITTMTEAHHYCPTCGEYYCKECVTFHRRMALLRDHTVYGKSDMDKWGQRTTSSKLKEKCVQHPTESITMVCLKCNELCCHVCISIKHSNCDRKEYIPTAAKNILQSSRKPYILNKIQTQSNGASYLKDKLNNSLEVLNTKQMTFLSQITDMRKQADDIFNEMERRVTSLANIIRGNISEDIVTYNDLILETCSIKEKLQNSDNKDECHVFMDVVKAENIVIKTNEKLINKKDIGSLVAVKEYHSMPDTNVIHILQQRKGVYQVSCRFPIREKDLDMRYIHVYNEIGGYVEGICQIPDDSFILVDSANFCLVWLSASYKLKKTIELPEAPSAVCNTELNHIAVSLNSKLRVFIIDKDITHVPTHDWTFNHRTCGLAYYDRKYYISDHAFTVYVYNTWNRICQKKIETYVRGSLLQLVRNIAIGKDTKTIYMTDIDKGLITMDLEGNVLSTLETKDTKGAYGVCVTSTGNVLVTNYILDKVIEVDEYGTTVLNTRLFTLTKGQSSRAICFDKQTSNVLISENPLAGSKMITVIC